MLLELAMLLDTWAKSKPVSAQIAQDFPRTEEIVFNISWGFGLLQKNNVKSLLIDYCSCAGRLFDAQEKTTREIGFGRRVVVPRVIHREAHMSCSC